MSLNSKSYVPKKNKIQWQWVLLVFLAVVLAFTGLDFLLKYERKEKVNVYGICGVNDAATRTILEKEATTEQTIQVSDYLFYGETLNLFSEPYKIDQKDFLVGKTIILKNICTQEEKMYILEKNVDSQIPLEDLEEGFYSAYLLQDTKTSRLVATDLIKEEFYTVTRNGMNHKVTLLADQSMFNNEEDTTDYLTEQFLLIKVEEEKAPTNIYDVVIDPGHFSHDSGYLEKGIQLNDHIEADETYRIAVLLKEKLESYGLKVIITRNSDSDIVNSYGLEGRLHKGYGVKAKYYLDLQMLRATNTSVRGTQVVYSSFSSNRFANIVLSNIVQNTSLVTSGVGKIPGVVAGGRLNGLDGRMMIREAGGKALAAATFSDKANSENGSFAFDNRFGMQAIIIEYIYLSNLADIEVWDAEIENIAQSTADGVARYLRIKEAK